MSKPKNPYVPKHETTVNYMAGMTALNSDKMNKALDLLLAEPPESPCYGLAIGNAALVYRAMGQFERAEKLALGALHEFESKGCPHPPTWVQVARTLGDAISCQGRHAEAIMQFNRVGQIAVDLMASFPAQSKAIEIENAHALSSWASSLFVHGSIDGTLDIFRRAITVYRESEALGTVGLAEVLTNYASALRKAGRETSAQLALQEALERSKSSGDADQLYRTQVTLIQFGSIHADGEEAWRILEEACDAAEVAGLVSTAFIRLCILATYALENRCCERGLQAIERARKLEDRLDKNDPNRAKIRQTEYQLRRLNGTKAGVQVPLLLEGAGLWLSQVASAEEPADLQKVSEEMHEHFRLLTSELLASGRNEEALVAFEVGRSLAYAVDVDPRYKDRVILEGPFEPASVALGLLRSVQARMRVDEVALVFALTPPDIVAFVISPTNVEVRCVSLPVDGKDQSEFVSDLHAIPRRIEAAVGSRSVPAICHDLAREVASRIKGKLITSLLPHSILHSVPWRAVLRNQGVPWRSIPAVVRFGLFLGDDEVLDRTASESCIALGFGKAGSSDEVDLVDEAREFANSYGTNARLVDDCKGVDVTAALQEGAGVVLVSCHGEFRETPRGNEVVLELSDGDIPAFSILPNAIRCDLVILSACDSGIYDMAWGDYPVGLAPTVLQRGARFCCGARCKLRASFAAEFFTELGTKLGARISLPAAFSEAAESLEDSGADLWAELATLEILGLR